MERSIPHPRPERLIRPLTRTLSGRGYLGARLMLALFLLAVFVDYGGGFGIKNAAGLAALGWVLLWRRSLFILHQRRVDLMVLLGIPLLLGSLHLLMSVTSAGDFDLAAYAWRFYRTVSSFLLILLFPLFSSAGGSTAVRQTSIGFRLTAAVVLIVFALHVEGIIDLAGLTGFAETYRVGFVGLDPRLPKASIDQGVVLAPLVTFAVPLIFGYELATSLPSAALLLLALLVVGSRGLMLGLVLIGALWLFLSLKRHWTKWIVRFGVIALATGVVLAFNEPLRFRVTGVLVERIADLRRDLSSQVRLGHLIGYSNAIAEEPLRAFVGMGPAGYIDNSVMARLGLTSRVSVTEFSILNLALYYGLPYALLYTMWLYRAAWRLWRLRRAPAFHKGDLGLLVGVSVFWLTGNTNPQMTGPFAIISYMLLIVRTAEIRRQSASAGASAGARPDGSAIDVAR